MRDTIKIGVRDVEMAANAASPYIYKQIFKEDFLKKIQEPEPEVDLFQKMGFVMTEQAKTNDLSELMKLKLEDYYAWLTEFDPIDILTAGGEISSLYMAQAKSTSVPKKRDV